MTLEELISIANGEKEADLVLKNGRIINVFSGEITEGDVAIAGNKIVGIGDYKGIKEIDLKGAYISPGFIDGHIHLESSMVTIAEFTKAVVPHGTTTVIADPHEIANVLGLDGIKFILNSSKYNPLSVYVMLPSCVPATSMETSGSELNSFDLEGMFQIKWIKGIGEMMNYPGVIQRSPDVLAKLNMAPAWSRIDGHAPGLRGKALSAYISAGIRSDHECTTVEEAREKLRQGMHIMVREGSTARNLEALLPLITPINSRYCFFVTDDKDPADLLTEGHIDFIIKKAIKLGLPPIIAIQMATINPASYFYLTEKGAITPGYQADIVIFNNFKDFKILKVFREGELIAEEGEFLWKSKRPVQHILRSSVNVAWNKSKNFTIPDRGKKIKVIGVIPQQIITEKLIVTPKVENGNIVPDIERDILKIAVIERHLASGNVGIGMVKGFGLKKGAIGSSIAHDSHNIVIVGTNEGDMLLALKTIEHLSGGIVAVAEGKVLETLPLPIAGLISDLPIEQVKDKLESLNTIVKKDLGSFLCNPFMTLSFMALPVIPALKLSDKGLIDVEQFSFTSIYED